MKRQTGNLVQIHLAVLLFGLAGLFGKIIALPASLIVLGRAFFAALFLVSLIKVKQEPLRIDQGKDILRFLFIGLMLAFHWVAFFQSIQLSSVAIGVLTFSSFPVFTTLLAWGWDQKTPRWQDVLFSALTIAGVYLVVPPFSIDDTSSQGVLWGLASGASFAVLALANRDLVSRYKSRQLSMMQNAVAAICLLPWLWLENWRFQEIDLAWLVLLGIVFTGLSHTLFIGGMKSIRPQLASIIASLEPVYAVFAAWWWLGEKPEGRIWWGGGLILLATTLAAVLEFVAQKRTSQLPGGNRDVHHAETH
ncbi:MAG: DMT family transporter [Bacteroidota bacterium]